MAVTKLWLWPLAFFASFLGISTTFKIFFDLAPKDQSLDLTVRDAISSNVLTSNFVGWSDSFHSIPWSTLNFSDIPLVALIFLLLAIIIALIILVISSEAGLILGISSLLNNKKVSGLTCIQTGLNKFWQLFMVHFFYSLLYIIFLGILIAPILLFYPQMSLALQVVFSVFIFFVIIPTLVVLDILVRYTVMYITLRQAKLQDAFNQAYTLFKENWLVTLETAVMIMALMMVLTYVVNLILNILSFFFIFFTSLMAGNTLATEITNLIGILIITIFVFLSYLIFTTFYLAMWTDIFERLEREVHYSKIHRSVRFTPWLHKKII
jgi:hypothetical protein